MTIGKTTVYIIGNNTDWRIMDTHSLITLAETLASHRGLTLSTLSTYAANDGKFFSRLKNDGAGCTLKTAQKLLVWFNGNWPADLEWPKAIPRPAKTKVAG